AHALIANAAPRANRRFMDVSLTSQSLPTRLGAERHVAHGCFDLLDPAIHDLERLEQEEGTRLVMARGLLAVDDAFIVAAGNVEGAEAHYDAPLLVDHRIAPVAH